MFELDSQNRKIIALLQENARLPFTEIGRRVHLTSPAVADRVRRLEESGVIQGYGARIDLRQVGYGFEVFINVTTASLAQLEAWAATHDEVLALHMVTGQCSALLRLGLTSPEHLESLICDLTQIGSTATTLVLKSQFEHRPRKVAEQLNR
jgi:Lrp/AsnC family leucine-responsive transcriptional regulator